MKGFKSTGNGPKYGSFTFPSKAGFGPSSGSVKNVSGYTRRAPKKVLKRAIGGLATNDVVNTPGGPADFSKGGKVGLAAKALARKGYAKHLQKRGAAKAARDSSIVVDGEVLWDDPSDPGISKLFKSLKGERKYSRGGMAKSFTRTPKIGK